MPLATDDKSCRFVLELMRQHYLPWHTKAQIWVYRRDGKIWLRIVDPNFRRAKEHRKSVVWRVLHVLPEKIRRELGFIYDLTPEEAGLVPAEKEFGAADSEPITAKGEELLAR